MNINNIKSILLSHVNTQFNKHNQYERKINMVQRYVNFIHSVKSKPTDIIEVHHILPKSLFPSYKNLSIHKWNAVKLTLRQHIIAHIMLHHIFGGKMSFALNRMCKKKNGLYNRLYEQTKLSYLNSEECKINAKKGAQVTKEKLKSGMRIYYREGISYGLMYEWDPRIKEYNLTKINNTPNKIKQQKEWGYNTSRLNIDTVMYNNGVIQKKFKDGDIIPIGWIKGGLRKYSKFYIIDCLLNNTIPDDKEFNRAIRFYNINIDLYKPLYERCHNKVFRDILYEDIQDYSIIADILDIDLCDCYKLYMNKELLLGLPRYSLCDILNMNKRDVNTLLLSYGISITENKSYTKVPDNFENRIILLLQEHGSINQNVANDLGISISHIQKLCVNFNINYHLYWSMKKRYKVDYNFAIGLWSAFNDIDIVSDILDVDEYNCKAIYKKKYGIVT